MCNVLVIDDEESIVLMITMALARYGCNVEIATDSAEGIRKFDEGHFNVVITDVRMPGIDGIEIAQHIRKSEKYSTPIIGMSGTPWLLNKGDFNAVLAKPFSLKILIHTIKNLSSAPLKAVAAE